MSDDQEITAPLEPEELATGWAEKADARPRCHSHLRFGAKTDLGQVRENNEDKFDYLEPDDPAVLALKGRTYAVADGMGGHAAGQIASEVALNLFIRTFYGDATEDIEGSLREAVRHANGYLVEVAKSIPGRNGMGTTLTAAVIRDDELYAVQVGDSRLYLLRGDEFTQVTEDHSWVQEQVNRGTMTLEEAEQSPYRNVITRSLGAADVVEPDITALQIEPGDRYLLCSDGLTGMVPNDEIAEILRQHPPTVAAWTLIDRANAHGGKDNVTAMVLEIQSVAPWTDAAAEDTAQEVEGDSGEVATGSDETTSELAEEDGADAEAPARRGGLVGLINRLR